MYSRNIELRAAALDALPANLKLAALIDDLDDRQPLKYLLANTHQALLSEFMNNNEVHILPHMSEQELTTALLVLVDIAKTNSADLTTNMTVNGNEDEREKIVIDFTKFRARQKALIHMNQTHRNLIKKMIEEIDHDSASITQFYTKTEESATDFDPHYVKVATPVQRKPANQLITLESICLYLTKTIAPIEHTPIGRASKDVIDAAKQDVKNGVMQEEDAIEALIQTANFIAEPTPINLAHYQKLAEQLDERNRHKKRPYVVGAMVVLAALFVIGLCAAAAILTFGMSAPLSIAGAIMGGAAIGLGVAGIAGTGAGLCIFSRGLMQPRIKPINSINYARCRS